MKKKVTTTSIKYIDPFSHLLSVLLSKSNLYFLTSPKENKATDPNPV